MKKVFTSILLVLAALILTVSATLAKPIVGQTSSTTLDACGFFVGAATPTRVSEHTSRRGVTNIYDRGTFTGVDNNYGKGPVASLGPVTGSYVEKYVTDAAGNVSGVERFRSEAGTIDQTFAYNAATNTWSVSVTATGDLAFLTSDTDRHCYNDPFPRP